MRVSGIVCLQGGGEFSPGCVPMDAAVLERSQGPVVVTALAGAVGEDYRTATANGVRYFLELGAPDVVAAPDVREDPADGLRALRSAGLLVLPGGSPSRLLDALTSSGAADVVRALLDADGTVVAASAGAMVLCDWTVLPDRRGPERSPVSVVPGLGVVPGILVLPHWSGGSSRGEWLRAIRATVPDDLELVGIPEESGLLVEDRGMTAVGRDATRLVNAQRDLEPGSTWGPG